MTSPSTPASRRGSRALVALSVGALAVLSGCGATVAEERRPGDLSGVESPPTAPSSQREEGQPDSGPRAEVRTTLAEAIDALAVAEEVDGSYDRDLYGGWIDADANGCDTRDEVLLVENRSPQAGVSDGCEMVDATWFSYYDQVSTDDASDFDIDHLVPLAEAHGSGGHAWPPARREAYVNDLGDRRALIAVSASSNRTKSAADPTTWMPAHQQCVYVSSWVAIKTRWSLSVDPAEQQALISYSGQCGQRRLSVRVAQLGPSGVRDARESILDRYPSVDPAPPPPQPPDQQPPDDAAADPRFDTCGDAVGAGYGPYQSDQDEYDWYTDGDSDGTVCE